MYCDICNIEMRSLDTHHIVSRTYGGNNSNSNLAKVCPNCHRKIHSGEIILEGWVSTTKGRILIWREKNKPSITGREDPKTFNIYNN